MWEQVARSAIDDVGTHADVVSELDHLGVIHTQSWTYDDPVARLGERLGRQKTSGNYSILAGTSPQRMINEAAASMMRGDISVALIVGAEAQATVRRFELDGDTPDWSFAQSNPVDMGNMLSEWYLPTEIRHRILPAWLTFALLAQARWARRGATTEDLRSMYEQMSVLSEVAANSSHAWLPVHHSADELAMATSKNRMITTPFTKLTTAFPFVDMAAANLLVTKDVADRWRVPEDRRVYLRGWGFARDESHIAARSDLASSPAMKAAIGDALSLANTDVSEINVFDVYSCFPSAVLFARDAIGLADDDPRPVSLTGGLPYHGGPGSNYMGHSISALVDYLRANPGKTGMVTGIGMHMTKHVAGIWSTIPGSNPLPSVSTPQKTVLADDRNSRLVREEVDSLVTIYSATVTYDQNGDPESVIAICELKDGTRCYAHTEDKDAIQSALAGDWVNLPASVVPTSAGTNRLLL